MYTAVYTLRGQGGEGGGGDCASYRRIRCGEGASYSQMVMNEDVQPCVVWAYPVETVDAPPPQLMIR